MCNWFPLRRACLPIVCCWWRSEEHTSELQSRGHIVCRLLLEKKMVHAAKRAMTKTTITRDKIGLIINAAVSRKHLAPEASASSHHALVMDPSCINYDITNTHQ